MKFRSEGTTVKDEMSQGLSRRALLRGTAGLAGAGALTALLAACGAATTPTTAATTAPATSVPATKAPASSAPASGGAAAPTATTASAASVASPTTAASASPVASTSGASGKTIAELRVAVAALPDSMDPQESISNVGMRLHYFTYDTLIRRDFLDNNKLVPSLATEWKRTDDRTLELTLRRDVLWQDGSPFTAADVKYTFDRIIKKDPKLEVASPGYFPLDSVEALDDYRVRFVSTGTDPVLEQRFAGLGAQIIPAKYHATVGTDAFRTKPLGTGPYRMLEYIKDDRITFEAHDRYFGGAPAAKKVTVRLIPETAARMAAVINGEVDLATNVPPDQIASLKTKKDVVIAQTPLANMHVLRFDMKAAPLDNKYIRQALFVGIDRQALTNDLWGGNAVAPRGFQFEGEPLFNAARPLTPYDPAKVKALLTQGNYAGQEIVYLATSPNYYTNEREAGEVIVEGWKALGINARLELLESAQKDAAFKTDTCHVTPWSATSGTADPDGYLWRNWGPDNGQQKNGWWTAASAAKYNELGTKARSILDQKQRFDLYQQMLDQYEDEAPGTILYAPKEAYALRSNIDWTPYSLYYLDLRNYNFLVK
jgi:peptide/nickel transport system substrate-binding protein